MYKTCSPVMFQLRVRTAGASFILPVGIANTGQDPLEASLRCLLSQGNSQNRVVLIFSRSWSSRSLEVSATDDLRWVAMKLEPFSNVKVHSDKAAEI